MRTSSNDAARDTLGDGNPRRGAVSKMGKIHRGIFWRLASTDGISSPPPSGESPSEPASDVDQAAGQILARLLPACGA